MNTKVEWDEIVDEIFIHLRLAEISGEGFQLKYLSLDKEIPFLFSTSSSIAPSWLEEAIEKKLETHFPESPVIEDLEEFKKEEICRYAILDVYDMRGKDGIEYIKKTFEVLDNSGTLVAIARRSLVFDLEFSREYLGLHGYWSKLPGLDGYGEEILIVLRRQPPEAIAAQDHPYSGYPSFYAWRILMELASDRDFQDRLDNLKNGYFEAKKIHQTLEFEREAFIQQLVQPLDQFIETQCEDKCRPMYYTDKIRIQVLHELYEEFLEEIEE